VKLNACTNLLLTIYQSALRHILSGVSYLDDFASTAGLGSFLLGLRLAFPQPWQLQGSAKACASPT